MNFLVFPNVVVYTAKFFLNQIRITVVKNIIQGSTGGAVEPIPRQERDSSIRSHLPPSCTERIR